MRAQRRLELVVRFLVDQPVLERDGPGAGHGRDEAVLLQRRPVLLAYQIESLESDLCRFATLIVERQLAVRAEDDAHQSLLQADLGPGGGRDNRRSRTWRKLDLRVDRQCGTRGPRHSREKLSAVNHRSPHL